MLMVMRKNKPQVMTYKSALPELTPSGLALHTKGIASMLQIGVAYSHRQKSKLSAHIVVHAELLQMIHMRRNLAQVRDPDEECTLCSDL